MSLEFGAGFIQFEDGSRAPVTNISWGPVHHEVDGVPEFRPLQEFEVEIPMPPLTMASVCRLVDEPEMADRIEVESHPDLLELNLQARGYYDGP